MWLIVTPVCSCACHSINIQQQGSYAVARKARGAAGVLRFKVWWHHSL